MHIPYYGEESESDSIQKPKQHRNKLVAILVGTILSIQGHPVLAEKMNKFDDYRSIEVKNTQLVDKAVERMQAKVAREVEEVLVTAKHINDEVDIDKRQFMARAGLSSEVLVHEFDDQTKTWRYIKTN